MQTRRWIQNVGTILVYLGLGAASALVWARIVPMSDLATWHSDMILWKAPAPNQYRPLVPWLAEMLRLLFPSLNLVVAYVLLRGFVTGLTLCCFDRYLRTWLTPAAAAGGALFLAAILPFTYFRVIQESDPINLLVFTLAFWAMARGQDLPLIPLVLFGTLNRETTALLPVLYLLGNLGVKPLRQTLRTAAILGGCWVLIYGELRLLYGHRAYYCDVIMWKKNIASLTPSFYVFLLYGAVWGLALAGARSGPTLLRRALLSLPFYIALHYVIALVFEVRLFLPYAPVLIPLAWLTLHPESAKAGINPAASGSGAP